jgi:hypothetical protein
MINVDPNCPVDGAFSASNEKTYYRYALSCVEPTNRKGLSRRVDGIVFELPSRHTSIDASV